MSAQSCQITPESLETKEPFDYYFKSLVNNDNLKGKRETKIERPKTTKTPKAPKESQSMKIRNPIQRQ